MGKGGGGFDTSGLEQAAAESNALQKKIYNESLERGTPWYDAGVQGLGSLLDYMGLEGGSVQSRDQIRSGMEGDFTTTQGLGSNIFADSQGRLVDLSQGSNWKSAVNPNAGSAALYTMHDNLRHSKAYDKAKESGDFSGYAKQYGFTPSQTTSTDTEALNSAVDAQYVAQQNAERPEDYGFLMQRFGEDQFREDPGYQFAKDEGQKAIERRLAAQGKTFSPEAMKELTRFNQGTADQMYGTARNRFIGDQTNIYNRLAGISGMGQQQVAGMNQSGQNYANQVGQTTTSLASSQAQAAQAESAAKGSMFGNLVSAGATAATMFSDKNLKTDIEKVGNKNGHNLYHFRYKDDPDTLYKGVMAQEVMETRPDAVVNIDGHLAVDYARIGLDMEVVNGNV